MVNGAIKGKLQKIKTMNARAQDPEIMEGITPYPIHVGRLVPFYSDDHPKGGITTGPVTQILVDTPNEIVFKTDNSTYRIFDYISNELFTSDKCPGTEDRLTIL